MHILVSNNNYYWIGGDRPTGVPKEGTDVGALAAGYASVTPLQLDLTAYHALTVLADWAWDGEEGETVDGVLAAETAVVPAPAVEAY